MRDENKMEEEKAIKREKAAINEARGEGKIDIDFQELMEDAMIDPSSAYPHIKPTSSKIFV